MRHCRRQFLTTFNVFLVYTDRFHVVILLANHLLLLMNVIQRYCKDMVKSCGGSERRVGYRAEWCWDMAGALERPFMETYTSFQAITQFIQDFFLNVLFFRFTNRLFYNVFMFHSYILIQNLYCHMLHCLLVHAYPFLHCS